MIYRVKVRGVQGDRGKSALFYSVLDIEAPDETEARRLGLVKARQRFFGTRDVTVMSADLQPRRLVVEGGKLKYSTGKPA